MTLRVVLSLLCTAAMTAMACQSSSPAEDGDDDTELSDVTDDLSDDAEAPEEERDTAEEGPSTCNGHEALCARRYSEVAYPCAHNAFCNDEEGFAAPNQPFGLTRQLADGVRAFMLDTYYCDEGVCLCHGDCMFGSKKLSDSLEEIASFLDRNPRNVITLILENYITPADTAAAMQEAGLLSRLHAQPLGQPWPTLEEMIDGGATMVVFADHQQEAPAWYHEQDQYAWETPWHNRSLEDFSCDFLRGDRDADLLVVNHFLYNALDLSSPSMAEIANEYAALSAHMQTCREQSGQIPNFVTVDHYTIGALLTVVDELNGLTP